MPSMESQEVLERSSAKGYGGERNDSHSASSASVVVKRTSLDDPLKNSPRKSCSKTLLVNVFRRNNPDDKRTVYAMIDDQSNKTLARSALFDDLKPQSTIIDFTLSSCQGSVHTAGRQSNDFVVEAIDGSCLFDLPLVIECDNIPGNKEEISSPDIARQFEHLKDIANELPQLHEDADILLLIGRDVPDIHHVMDQRTGPPGTPFAQQLRLGWTIIGEVCVGQVHITHHVNVNRTHVLKNGRTTLLNPCPNNLVIDIFEKTQHDNKLGLSGEDQQFLRLMDENFKRTDDGFWSAPLPFKGDRPRLPDNRPQALKRALILDQNLKKNPEKREHFVTFMKKLIDKGHAVVAPDNDNEDERWYLPLFGVYHPKKPGQIRGVFDSSAQYNGVSLNDVLMTGPDLTNNLLGILIRFRKEPIAVSGDIEQMFYCFKVDEEHRKFLKFLWYRDNNPDNELIDYCMTVHVFGNSPSPAVATYGLRKTVVDDVDPVIKDFVENNFYVDDGLASFPTSSEAVNVMQQTKDILEERGKLRLHKIASNDKNVLKAFDTKDLAKELTDIDLCEDLPQQRSLGLLWNLNSDTFTYKIDSSDFDKPYTRRGVLSTINSLYDPIGFITPIVIQGKILLRELMSSKNTDWDTPLPEKKRDDWVQWRSSLDSLNQIHIPRSYVPYSFASAEKKEVWIYSDASEKAISAVAYLRTTDTSGKISVSFLLGKSKVAPTSGHTIPRLELCAAVLAIELGLIIEENLGIPSFAMKFFTDSKVVLGYIHNQTRRFYLYVANRVDRIRQHSTRQQWNYVPTDVNPADQGSRGIRARDLPDSMWLLGSSHTHKDTETSQGEYYLIDPTSDTEVRPDTITTVQVNKTVASQSLGTKRFEKFSTWTGLIAAVAFLHGFIRHRHGGAQASQLELRQEAERFVLSSVQREFYNEEVNRISNKNSVSRDSSIVKLNPFLDKDGLLRLGGRLNNADLDNFNKNPIIIPGKSHVARLLVRHHHEQIYHQGRHFTEGAVRNAGYWIVGGKRLIQSVIHSCVTCRKSRGKLAQQLMADLPSDRVSPGPPFSFVGVDTFGPWNVLTRKTRGGAASSKRWAVLFTCLTTRAIHIEVIEEMSSASFINALRRFVSIRGKVKQFRSDRGTNFIGAVGELASFEAINVEDKEMKDYLLSQQSVWLFNPPHASHMGGVWERLIGVVRKILDSMLAQISAHKLTHEVLTTFMAEICAIVNGRPITPVSSDPEDPAILSPSTLLTQKKDHVVSDFKDGEFTLKDMYKSNWKMVQHLADNFWARWKREYLNNLQARPKWTIPQKNLKTGDVVLLREKSIHRNDWPLGRIDSVIASKDSLVRKAVVCVYRDGKICKYTRPISEMVLLLED